MNIVYNTDNNFVPQVCASICSVCENNADVENIHFHILGAELSEESKNNLCKLADSYSRELFCYEIGNINSRFDFSFDTHGWRPVILPRLPIDKIIPDTISRVIYLDGDTIVRSSISALDSMNLDGCPIAGIIEPTVNKNQLDIIGLSGKPYINSGVMVIDADMWRKQNIGSAIIDYYASHDGRLFAPDQDAINGAMKGKIKYISPTYNYCNTFDIYSYKSICKIAKPVDYRHFVSEETFNEAHNDPKIIHYLGEERPWRTGNRHRFRSDFEKYLSLTPYGNMPFEEGWQTYFSCFYLFNAIMKPMPVLRYKIITKLIPAFMKYRKKQLAKEKKQ